MANCDDEDGSQWQCSTFSPRHFKKRMLLESIQLNSNMGVDQDMLFHHRVRIIAVLRHYSVTTIIF